ncbi:MAG: hypothetical protein KDE59_06280 [Anaerolineales bacterium]|nr:hypothetical protein [Anaerolineales bacterium]MCB0009787.1 hypothetical protein [Anaerolineales bacterium]MCB0014845.1 hypothetical protein [Anaerolineales bacterium]
MIGSHLGKAAFRIGFFLFTMSGLLAFFTEAGTAERVISQVMLVVSILFLLLIIILVRVGR